MIPQHRPVEGVSFGPYNGTMLELLLWTSAGLWSVMLVQIVLVRVLSPNLARRTVRHRGSWPLVSIVVPARDEEGGIETAVRSFCTQDYPSIEVIVVDDVSSDSTPEILARLATRHDNLEVVSGTEPPAGWLGKVWALEQGRRRATGEWLLFVDADVVYHRELVSRSIDLVLEKDYEMLVLGANLDTSGALLAAVLCNIYLVGMGLFPAWIVSRSRNRFLAAGAGVFNLVRRDALESCGAFASLRRQVVDDVGLGFRVKAAGHRILLARSRDMVSVRMYSGVRDAVHGFTKNVYHVLGRVSPLLLPVLFSLGFGLSLLPYVAFALGLMAGHVLVPAVAALVLMHAVHAVTAQEFRLPWQVTFLSPFRELTWWWIVTRSVVHHRRHGLVWRGRSYPE